MYRGSTALGVICARGGSKGLPRKNLADIGGRPMIGWSVRAAGQSALLDRTIVSSDDAEILEAAREAGGETPFVRPPELATDGASLVDVLIHASAFFHHEYDLIVLMQTTSPFRRGSDIDDCIRALVDADATACVTVSEAENPPELAMRRDEAGKLLVDDWSAFQKPRQAFPKHYYPNGMVFVVRRTHLMANRRIYADDTIGVVTPPERSVDIDNEHDLALARFSLDRNPDIAQSD